VVSVDFLMIAAEVEVGREQGKRGERSRRGGDGVVFLFSRGFYGLFWGWDGGIVQED
jgi:hypothetical protein